MSQNIDDRLVKELKEVQLDRYENRALPQSYLQNFFAAAWSKLAALLPSPSAVSQPEARAKYQCKRYEPDVYREHDLYSHFTDRVDPSLYYTIFFPHERF